MNKHKYMSTILKSSKEIKEYLGARSITSSKTTSGRLGVCVFPVVSVLSELVTSSTTAPGAGSTAIP